MVQRDKSLLAPGIARLEGRFDAGDFVEIADLNGHVFAKGKTMMSSADLLKGIGKKRKGEVIHRDNLVLIG